MQKQFVMIPAIPGRVYRGSAVRTNVDYAKFGIATWRSWCRRHNVELIVIDRPETGNGDGDVEIPPTIQRWMAARRILISMAPGTQIAMIDADTMARWDAPNLFARAGNRFAAAHGQSIAWIERCIGAYQHLFPEVLIRATDYLNAGVVVMTSKHLHILDSLLDVACRHRRELRTIQQSGNYGTDEALLNFILKRAAEPIEILPRAFNLLHCFPMTDELITIDRAEPADCAQFATKAFSNGTAFDFVHLAYVWHFTNVVSCRHVVMRETWRRVMKNYSDIGPQTGPRDEKSVGVTIGADIE